MTDQQLIDEGYVDGKKSFEWHVRGIGEQFNFERVHKAMIATDWHWKLGVDSDGEENMGIPSVDTIKRHALSLLKDAYETGNSTGTGGFMAGWDSGELYLVFRLEEASA